MMSHEEIEAGLQSLRDSKNFDESIHYANPTNEALSNFFNMEQLLAAVLSLKGKRCTEQNLKAAIMKHKVCKYSGFPVNIKMKHFEVLEGYARLSVMAKNSSQDVAIRWLDTFKAVELLKGVEKFEGSI